MIKMISNMKSLDSHPTGKLPINMSRSRPPADGGNKCDNQDPESVELFAHSHGGSRDGKGKRAQYVDDFE